MGKLVDYPCKNRDFSGLLLSDPASLGLTVPELYQNAEAMAKMVRAQKAEHGSICKLPMDSIALSENLGASVIYDTSPTGPRKKEDVLASAGEVLECPAADPSSGRMAEIMKGLRLLKDQGEIPVFSVHGLYDTLNFMAEIQKVVMDFSMNPGLMQQVSDRIRNDILKTCLAAEEAGARAITFEDGSGGLNLLGPKFVKRSVKAFLYPMMKDFEQWLHPDTVVIMCPKISFMLTGCDKAEFVTQSAAAPDKSWLENYLADPDIRFAGAICNKDLGETAGEKLTYLKLL